MPPTRTARPFTTKRTPAHRQGDRRRRLRVLFGSRITARWTRPRAFDRRAEPPGMVRTNQGGVSAAAMLQIAADSALIDRHLHRPRSGAASGLANARSGRW